MPDIPAGLGTQLRHLIELLDDAVSEAHDYAGLHYRPRYTPIMRALGGGTPLTIGQLADAAQISQPAATQTVALMLKGGFVDVVSGPQDARQRVVALSTHGRTLLPRLEQAWAATDRAAAGLDAEAALAAAVAAALAALDRQSFGARIAQALRAPVSPPSRKKT
ncbi:MAG: MarR family transcriptional regulator [Betaproteobacteria bacterium]